MNLIRRQINILKHIHENPAISIKELGEILDISMQTIKTDLKNMEKLMAEYDVRIEILPGNNLRVWGQENMNYMLSAFQTMQEFSYEKQIMLLLVLDNDFVVMQDIADRLFASKSLIEKIMSLLLKKYPDELESARRHGIRNISSQLERRNRFSEIISPYFRGLDFQREMKSFNDNHFPIFDYVSQEEIQAAMGAVEEMKHSSFVFTDESLVFIFLQLIFAKSCYRRWHKVPMGNLMEDMLAGLPNHAGYQDAAEILCQVAGLKQPEEISYFTYLVYMLRKHVVSDISSFEEAMAPVVKEIMDTIYQRLAIDFSGDQELLRGLMVHLNTTIVRRDFLNSHLADRGGMEIKQQYPIGFEMSVIAAEIIEDHYSYALTDEEMMYMTLHFQAGIERMKAVGKRIRVLVVCHYGLAAASLIAARVEGAFANIDIVGNISMQRFRSLDKVEADLILSTENMEAAGEVPVIYVTPMLPDRELRAVRQFIETRCVSNLLLLYILNARVLDIVGADSKEDVLKLAVGELEKHSFVTEDYLETVLEREQVSPTDLNDIAVPHGNPEFVQETQLVIVRLTKPVFWSYSEVKYVFLFAVSKAQFEKNFVLFSNFYKRLTRSQVQNELRKSNGCNDEDFKRNLASIATK